MAATEKAKGDTGKEGKGKDENVEERYKDNNDGGKWDGGGDLEEHMKRME
jgi:hypothetical protein